MYRVAVHGRIQAAIARAKVQLRGEDDRIDGDADDDVGDVTGGSSVSEDDLSRALTASSD